MPKLLDRPGFRSAASFAAVVAAALGAAGCDPGGAQAADAAPDLLAGTIEGNRYRLPAWGLQLTVPESWYMPRREDLEAIQATLKQGTAIGWRKRAGRVNLLAAAFAHPLGSTAAFNPGAQLFAEEVADLSTDPDATTYLRQVVERLCDQSPAVTERSAGEFTLGSVRGATVSVDRPAGNVVVRQRYYAARVGRHMVVVVASSADERDDRTLQRIVSELTLGGPGAPPAPSSQETAAGG